MRVSVLTVLSLPAFKCLIVDKQPYGIRMCQEECATVARCRSHQYNHVSLICGFYQFDPFSLTCTLSCRNSSGRNGLGHSKNSTEKRHGDYSKVTLIPRGRKRHSCADGLNRTAPVKRRMFLRSYKGGVWIYNPETNSHSQKFHLQGIVDICYFAEGTLLFANYFHVSKLRFSDTCIDFNDDIVSTALNPRDLAEGEKEGVVYAVGDPKRRGRNADGETCLIRIEQPKNVTKLFKCRNTQGDMISVSHKRIYLFHKKTIFILNHNGKVLNNKFQRFQRKHFCVSEEDVLYFTNGNELLKMNFLSNNDVKENVIFAHSIIHSLVYSDNILFFLVKLSNNSYCLNKVALPDKVVIPLMTFRVKLSLTPFMELR